MSQRETERYIMELREILRAFLFITAACSFGISVLSFFTLAKMKSVPKKNRNLMEYQKPKQYTTLGISTLGISAVALVLALWM
jgi:hypothetical protein